MHQRRFFASVLVAALFGLGPVVALPANAAPDGDEVLPAGVAPGGSPSARELLEELKDPQGSTPSAQELLAKIESRGDGPSRGGEGYSQLGEDYKVSRIIVEPVGVSALSEDTIEISGVAVDSVQSLDSIGLSIITLGSEVSLDRAREIAKDVVSENGDSIARAAPDFRRRATASPQESAPWGLDRIDQRNLPMDDEYSYTADGTGVTAYVVDTGIDGTHPDLTDRVAEGVNCVSDSWEDPGDGAACEPGGNIDGYGHGTHVAGTIGGTVSGVAKNVTLMPVRVLDDDGYGWDSDIIAGLNWIIEQQDADGAGPAVVNMSLGGYDPFGEAVLLDNAVQAVIDAGITMVVAAGNDEMDSCDFSPAHVTDAITVNASTSTDGYAWFSNWGECSDIYAPGASITSSVPGGGFESWSGTSMAAPHVAGAAALLLDANNAWTPAQVWGSIETSATPVIFGAGPDDPNLLLYTGTTAFVPGPDRDTVEVTSLAPGFGDCSGGYACTLRQAIHDVAPDGTITFDEALAGGTITLDETLSFGKGLHINGDINEDGTPDITISGADQVNIFTVGGYPNWGVEGDQDNGYFTVTLNGLILTDGAGEVGGGIQNRGFLHVTDSVIKDAWVDYYGGGIYNNGMAHLTVEDSTIRGSYADYNGGGILNWQATATILTSAITDNFSMGGGGIFTKGFMSVEDSTIADNAAFFGGGLYNAYALDIAGSTVSGNAALLAGGILNDGLIGGFLGLGQDVNGQGATSLMSTAELEPQQMPPGGLVNSTIANNSAALAGGILNVGWSAITYTTIAGNTAEEGAGVFQEGGTTWLGASIIAGNPGVNCSNYWGDFYSLGNNVTGRSCNLTDRTDRDAGPVSRVLETARDRLVVLQDNGGPTETIALAEVYDNPAINRVNPSSDLGCPDTDQRGFNRPMPEGSHCDAGAYELQVPAPPAPPAPPASGPAVDRVMGYDRYGTAVAVSQAAFPGGGVPVVYIATGLEFPDALAGSAAALRAGGPLLLVRTDSIPSVVADELARLQPARIVVQGGSAAVSDAVVDQLRGFTTGAVTRNAGATRYETAALTAGAFTGTGGTVILATGGVFADALAAGSLYGSYLGPVLLTKPGAGLAADTRAQLARLNPSRVFILGGTGAVSAGVEAEVKALGFEVVRLGGTDRYETSALVGEWVRARAGYGSTALAATGKTFPDGLTAGVLAGKWNAPVLLTNGTCWSPATKSFLDRLNPARVTLLGGLAAQGLGVANLTTCR